MGAKWTGAPPCEGWCPATHCPQESNTTMWRQKAGTHSKVPRLVVCPVPTTDGHTYTPVPSEWEPRDTL